MLPIVAQLKPSDEQLPAVQARGRDVVVTAGAGTGKTLTLVARYLSLLAAQDTSPAAGQPAVGGRPSTLSRRRRGASAGPAATEVPVSAGLGEATGLRSIVAITFTRKAAREMRNRVREAIRLFLQTPDLDPDERGRWLDIYSGLDAARIGTIHSLCGEILRSHPAEARLDPRFEVLEEGQTNLLQSRAIDDALASAANDPFAADLFSSLGERSLRKVLKDLLAKRLESSAGFARLPADPLTHWQTTLQGLDPEARPNELDVQAADALPRLRVVFNLAVERLTSLKAERRALDYADLEGRTLSLLRDNEAVRQHWQQVISAVLVDEFQDTNRRQYELIKLLCSTPGQLFLVGDAKQSIYRFQGADVAVFRDEREHIGSTGGLNATLSTSYRAHRALVQGLNDLMRPVLGTQVDPDRPYAQPFEPLAPFRGAPVKGLTAPFIELHLAPGKAKDGALEVAARHLVARLQELLQTQNKMASLDESGGAPRLGYGDIAILCRASTSFPAYEDALRDAGLPFLTVAGRGFWDRPEVRDLLNTLLALSDPTDDLALAGLLRSPVIGLSDVGLYQCKLARTAPALTLWDVLRAAEPRAVWSAPDRAAAERAVVWVTEMHALVGRTAVADVLKSWLDRTDYRAALLGSGNPRSTRNVDRLLSAAFTSGIVGVGEFLEYVQGLKDSGAREGEARAAVEGAVQIMTVHQAKGLEFPVVVVGDVGHGTSSRSSLLFDDELAAALPLKGEDKEKGVVIELAKARDKDREAAESARLFYVACTRAREKLLLSGRVDLKDGVPTRVGGWLATLLGPDLLNLDQSTWAPDHPGQAMQRLERTVGQTAVSCTIYWPTAGKREDLRSIADAASSPAGTWPATTALPDAPPLLRPLTLTGETLDQRTAERERIPAQRVWRVVPGTRRPTAPAWVLGSLVHEALAAWRFVDDTRPASFDAWAESRARSYGLADAAQINDAVRQCARLLSRFVAHDLFKEMNSADLLLHEVPYNMQTEGRVESGIIDALYRRGQEWTLVEFKTDELRKEEDLPGLLGQSDYVAQCRTYVRAVERLLGVRPRAILCFLNVAGAVHLYEPTGL